MRLLRIIALLPLLVCPSVFAQVDSRSQVWADASAAILQYAAVPLIIALMVWVAFAARRIIRTGDRSEKLAGVQYGVWPAVIGATVLLTGMVLSFLQAHRLMDQIHVSASQRFGHESDRLEASMQSQLEALADTLRGVRGLVLASDAVTPGELRTWVLSREIDKDTAGARGLGLIDQVPRAQAQAYEAAQRRNGNPHFKLNLQGSGEEIFAVRSIEPAERNAGQLGLDVAALAVTRNAAERAMRQGQPALSGRVVNELGAVKFDEFNLYLPIKTKSPAFNAWVYAPVWVASFLEHSLASTQGLMEFQLFDGLEANAASLIYDSQFPTGFRPDSYEVSVGVDAKRMFTVTRPIQLGGQVFHLRAVSSDGFEGLVDVFEPARTAFAGTLLSVFAALIVWLLLVGRVRAEAVARGMTADLSRLALVAERTSDTVMMTDAKGLITWVNEGFTRMTGYSAEEAMGKSPGQLLQSEKSSPEVIAAMRADLRALRISRHTILNRTKDGRDYWLELEIQPLLDDKGRLTGFMAVESDVTAVIEARDALTRENVRMDNILAATNVGTWEWNFQTSEFRSNDRFVEMMGFSADDAKPDVWGFWESRVHPDDLVRAKNTLLAVLQGPSNAYSCDSRARRKDGSWMWVLSRGRVMSRSADGRVEWLAGIHTDITETKRHEEHLRDAESFLERAGRIAGIGAWQIDLKSKKIIWNDQTCDIHGVEPGFVPTMEEAMAFYPMPDRVRVQEAIAAAVEEGRSWDLVVQFNNIDGEQLWVRTVGEVEFDDSGAVRLLGSLQNVTRDQLTQLKIEENRALLLDERRRLEGILDGTRAGTWEWNLATDSCIVNSRCAEMLGYDVEELANLSITRWIQLEHPDDLPTTTARMEAYLQKKVDFFESESRVRRKDGGWIWVLSRAKVSRWSDADEPLWISGTYLDISERKAAELALSKTTSTLQAVLDSAVDVAVFATDLSQTITVFNKGAERMLGYDASDVIGKRNIAILIDRSQVAMVRETLSLKLGREPTTQEAFEEVGSGVHGTEWNLVRKDRSLVPTSLVIAPMYGADGEHLGYLGIGQDISRQKAYEESLRQAMITAEQSSVAKSQFVANMSHEIRTPMNAILGMLKLLHSTPLTERQRDYAGKTEGAAKSLLGILNDILDFSKVEAGKLELDTEPFLVEQLMADLSVIMSSNLGGKNVDLLFDMDPALPPCLRGDVMRIKQILINLGGNAVKFTQEGQIVIRWALAGLVDGVAKIDVTVQDSGIGIAVENQAKIFEGFSQAESNTTRRFGGTGLGLAISQRLIQLMDARLVVNSELGKGSTFGFTVMLPVAEMPPADDATQPKVPVRTGLQVLLVDDNPVALGTSSSMMQSLGWHVSQAQTGEQALERVERDVSGAAAHLDAIFVDWQMPGMDGWQTLRQVKRLYGEKPAPALIMLSGQGRELLAKRSQRELELLNGFLVKPLTAGMFGHALMHAFDVPLPADTEESVHATRVQRLHGMRILVVEDNLINQQVAQELLKSEGASVTLADNGRLGVDAVASAQPPFDVVLMDLQMPVMDGLSAARAIRQELGLATLPVVAMTANAMASDRQACLEAGMNDHVGKPFDLTHLLEVLIRHTHWQVDATVPHAPVQVAPGPAAVQVQWPQGMDGDGALARMGGNIGLFVKTLRAFARDTALLPDRVDALVAAGDIATARRELHGFKGLTATLGVNALSALAAKAEALAHPSDKSDKADKADKAGEPIQQLRVLLAQIRTGVALWMPALQALAGDLAQENEAASDAPARPAADGVNLLGQLSELLEVLRNSDMQAMELHATLRQSCPDELAEVLEPLDTAMADLDFEMATVECEKLVTQLTQ